MAKTARFTTVVEKAGKPKVHLALLDPKKDRALQRAIKAHRVMMVHQETVGTARDFGTIGFDRKVAGQILIFPMSLEDFADSRIVGVNFDLVDQERETKAEAERRRKKTERAKPKTPVRAPKPSREDPEEVAHPPEPEQNEEVAELKRGIERAVAMLEEGRQVPAFNLLQKLLR